MSCEKSGLCPCESSKYLGAMAWEGGYRSIPPWLLQYGTQFSKPGKIWWLKEWEDTSALNPCVPLQEGMDPKQEIKMHKLVVPTHPNLMQGISVTPAPPKSIAMLPPDKPLIQQQGPPYIM